jgi:hypothetical protein
MDIIVDGVWWMVDGLWWMVYGALGVKSKSPRRIAGILLLMTID